MENSVSSLSTPHEEDHRQNHLVRHKEVHIMPNCEMAMVRRYSKLDVEEPYGVCNICLIKVVWPYCPTYWPSLYSCYKGVEVIKF